MLLAQQPQGCIRTIAALPPQTTTHYKSTKLFDSLLSPSTVTIRIEEAFTPDSIVSWKSPDPFDPDPSSPTSPTLAFRRPPRSTTGIQISSPGLPTLRRAKEQLRAELNHGSERWDEDDGLDPQIDSYSKLNSTQHRTRRPEDKLDIFEVQRHLTSSPESHQCDGDELPNNFRSLAISPANEKPANTRDLTQDPPLSPSSTKQGVFILKIRQLHSPLQSPTRDPRTLFGSPSQETHLPWVTKLGENRFAMAVSPKMLSRDGPPPRSIWDATEDEFDRWPTAMEARAELETIRRNATTKRSSFVKTREPELSVAEQIAEAMKTQMGDGTRTDDELKQQILELEDMDCGNPWGRDLHDTIIASLFGECAMLPKHAPARCMHVLNAKAYTSSTDPVIKAARPRLCDAVATILAYTNQECLEDFLNPEIQVFEWRRNGNCVMIRREGNKVAVGNYYNFGTTYQWGFLVRSTIDADGVWSETWASVSQGTTPVGTEGVLYDQFEADGTDCNVEPDDEEFALYVGRDLAHFLLKWEVWNYHKWWRYHVEWETDGRVTRARDRNMYPVGLTFD